MTRLERELKSARTDREAANVYLQDVQRENAALKEEATKLRERAAKPFAAFTASPAVCAKYAAACC